MIVSHRQDSVLNRDPEGLVDFSQSPPPGLRTTLPSRKSNICGTEDDENEKRKGNGEIRFLPESLMQKVAFGLH